MKRTILLSALSLFIFSLSACSEGGSQKMGEQSGINTNAEGQQTHYQVPKGMKTAYFASGCFWCVEAVYEEVKGVHEAISGFAGGQQKNPTYRQVSAGTTNHAESVKVIYDPNIVDYRTLVKVYFGSQDPTQAGGQGPDHGQQYRSIIFYQNKKEQKIARQVKNKVAKDYSKPVAASIEPYEQFYSASEHHQNYEKKHPNNRYIQGVSLPRIHRFEEKFPGLLKSKTAEQ